jgi:hypothetical protein
MKEDQRIVKLYFDCVEKAKSKNLSIEVTFNRFIVSNQNKGHLGNFNDVKEMWAFFCGYNWGWASGLVKGRSDQLELLHDELKVK